MSSSGVSTRRKKMEKISRKVKIDVGSTGKVGTKKFKNLREMETMQNI